MGYDALGSGVVIDAEKGLIITNDHVIEEAKRIVVAFSTGFYIDAELIDTNPDVDIAVIKVPPEKMPLRAMPIADSARVTPGIRVYVIGNPHGLDYSVSSGIVSNMHRTLDYTPVEDWIQTDAAVNPGNSGGALINEQGELIGINALGDSGGMGGSIGLNFAISSNLAMKTATFLINGSEAKPEPLGIDLQDILAETERQKLGILNRFGIRIVTVYPGHRAANAGIRSGDVLVKVDKIIPITKELIGTYLNAIAGNQVTLVILRNKQEFTITVP